MQHTSTLRALVGLALALFLAQQADPVRAAHSALRSQPRSQLDPGGNAGGPQKRPHIVFILADDLGWTNANFTAELLPDGATPPEMVRPTPHLDQLAREGRALSRHYAYRVCSPSRSSFQSGRFGVHVNMVNQNVLSVNRSDPIAGYAGIPPAMTGMGQILREQGYATSFVGKWDVGMAVPEQTPASKTRGYDDALMFFHHSLSYYEKTPPKTDPDMCDQAQNHTMRDLWLVDKASGYEGPAGKQGTDDVYVEDYFLRKTLQVIGEHDARARPLFLQHHFHLVHTPLEVPQRYIDMFPQIPNKERRIYTAMVKAMDDYIGLIVRALKAKGMWDDTLLVFSSDNGGPIYVHGGANNYPLRGGKEADFEGGIRTAALVSGGALPQDVRGLPFTGMVTIADWYATFARLAGAPERGLHDAPAIALGLPDVDSVDVWDALASPDPTGQSPRVRYHISPESIMVGDYKMVTGSNWGMWCPPVYPTTHIRDRPVHLPVYLIDYYNTPPVAVAAAKRHNQKFKTDCGEHGCLFNVAKDPSERHDLSEEMPELAARLRAELFEANKSLFAPNRGQQDPAACAVMQSRYTSHGATFYGPFRKL